MARAAGDMPGGWTADSIAKAVCHFIAHNGCMRPSEWGHLGIWDGEGEPPMANYINLATGIMHVGSHKSSRLHGARTARIHPDTIELLRAGAGRYILGDKAVRALKTVDKIIKAATGHKPMDLRRIMASLSIDEDEGEARDTYCAVAGHTPAVQAAYYQGHRVIAAD